MSLYIVFPTRLALSRVPKCAFFRVPYHLAFSKLPKCYCFMICSSWLEPCYQSVATFVVPLHLAPPSKLPKCRHFRALPRSYQSVVIFRFSPSDLRPRSYQSIAAIVFPSHLAPHRFKFFTLYTTNYRSQEHIKKLLFSRPSMSLETIIEKNLLIDAICAGLVQ